MLHVSSVVIMTLLRDGSSFWPWSIYYLIKDHVSFIKLLRITISTFQWHTDKYAIKRRSTHHCECCIRTIFIFTWQKPKLTRLTHSVDFCVTSGTLTSWLQGGVQAMHTSISLKQKILCITRVYLRNFYYYNINIF